MEKTIEERVLAFGEQNECRLKNGICPFENQFRKTLKKAMEEQAV